MALVPRQTQPGDVICVPFGCSSLTLLYNAPDRTGCYCTRGEVYMGGIVLGESIQQWQEGQSTKEVFLLV